MTSTSTRVSVASFEVPVAVHTLTWPRTEGRPRSLKGCLYKDPPASKGPVMSRPLKRLRPGERVTVVGLRGSPLSGFCFTSWDVESRDNMIKMLASLEEIRVAGEEYSVVCVCSRGRRRGIGMIGSN